MSQTRSAILAILLAAIAIKASAQHDYTVIRVANGGTISGVVRWSGPQPRGLDVTVNKDPEICDPESHKTINMERMVIGPDGGMANTVVFIKNITQGKAIDLPARFCTCVTSF